MRLMRMLDFLGGLIVYVINVVVLLYTDLDEMYWYQLLMVVFLATYYFRIFTVYYIKNNRMLKLSDSVAFCFYLSYLLKVSSFVLANIWNFHQDSLFVSIYWIQAILCIGDICITIQLLRAHGSVGNSIRNKSYLKYQENLQEIKGTEGMLHSINSAYEYFMKNIGMLYIFLIIMMAGPKWIVSCFLILNLILTFLAIIKYIEPCFQLPEVHKTSWIVRYFFLVLFSVMLYICYINKAMGISIVILSIEMIYILVAIIKPLVNIQDRIELYLNKIEWQKNDYPN